MSDISDEVVRYVLGCRVGACHILCSSKRMVDDITERLGKVLDVLSITGDSTYKDQIACAKK